MVLPIKQDHVEKGLELVLSQWDNSPKVRGLIESFLRELNKTEDCLFEIINETGVLVAEGVNLDLIGLLVNESRGGKDDDQYRLAILNRILSRGLSGTPNEIESSLSDLVGATEVSIFEHFPASFIPRLNIAHDPEVIPALQRIKPVGVRATQVIFDPYDESVIPAELVFSQNELVDNNLNNIATDNLDDILVQQNSSPADPKAILAELGDNTEQAEFGSLNEVGLFGTGLESARFGQGGSVGQWAIDDGVDNLTANGDLVDFNIIEDLTAGSSPLAELDAI